MQSMTAQQIRELAIHRLAGNVVFLQDVPRNLAAEVFLPLALMDEEARAELSRKLESGECVDLYQFTDRAMPRGVNGWPIFASFLTISRADIIALQAEIDALRSVPRDGAVGSSAASPEAKE